eukprot:Amastigsp_a346754_16.p3 type:complete len:252 gc:universal Amastigsp_a346754_16:465-1220(+)
MHPYWAMIWSICSSPATLETMPSRSWNSPEPASESRWSVPRRHTFANTGSISLSESHAHVLCATTSLPAMYHDASVIVSVALVMTAIMAQISSMKSMASGSVSRSMNGTSRSSASAIASGELEMTESIVVSVRSAFIATIPRSESGDPKSGSASPPSSSRMAWNTRSNAPVSMSEISGTSGSSVGPNRSRMVSVASMSSELSTSRVMAMMAPSTSLRIGLMTSSASSFLRNRWRVITAVMRTASSGSEHAP